jgi:hypothetical protein
MAGRSRLERIHVCHSAAEVIVVVVVTACNAQIAALVIIVTPDAA